MLSGITFASADLWVYFMVGVLTLLLLDLFVFNKKDHVIHLKEALLLSAFWIAVALGFNAWIWFHNGHDLGLIPSWVLLLVIMAILTTSAFSSWYISARGKSILDSPEEKPKL